MTNIEHGVVVSLDELSTQFLEDCLLLTDIRKEEIDEFGTLLTELNCTFKIRLYIYFVYHSVLEFRSQSLTGDMFHENYSMILR